MSSIAARSSGSVLPEDTSYVLYSNRPEKLSVKE